MKILFIVLPYLPEHEFNKISSKKRSFKNIPYGVMTLTKYIKEKTGDEHLIEILDLNIVKNGDINKDLEKKLKEKEFDVVGLSLMFDTSFSYIEKISEFVKLFDSNIITLIGGSAATMSYKEIIETQKFIDAVIYSEGEEPFLRFLLSENKIKFMEDDISFVTKESLESDKKPIPSKLENLDTVIDIDYSMIDFNEYNMEEAFSPHCSMSEDKKHFFLITSRGCPFKCTFCMHSAHDDKSVRYASVEKLIDHIIFMINTYGVNTLTIYDDQILYNKKRAKQFFKELAKFNLRVELPNGITAMFIDEELARNMREAGVDTVQLAIESGSEYVINKLMRKPVKLDRVKTVISYLRKYNFWIQAFFVNGMPGELDSHREETINYIKDVGFDWSSFSLAFPSMGSKLYEQCLENGYIESNTSILTVNHTNNEYIIKNPDYSAEHIIEQTYLMNLDANFVNNYRMKEGDYHIAEKAFRDVLKRYPFQAFAIYYLLRALILQNSKSDIDIYYQDLLSVVLENPKWEDYFNYFNIDYKKVLND